MIKIINEPDNMISEMHEGYLKIYDELFEKVPETMAFTYKKHKPNTVPIIIGGGSGLEPWLIGYVGHGLATGAVLGNVFTAPPAKSIINTAKNLYNDRGVLFLATNHMGDVLNFGLVKDLIELEGIESECIFVADDISSEKLEKKSERRGVAGIALVLKIAGSASYEGLSLEEIYRITNKANNNTYTLSVTTSPGYFPSSGRPMFEMEEGFIEYGMGFNGEPGIKKEKFLNAHQVANNLVHTLIEDAKISSDEEIGIMINGFGNTSILELCIIGNDIYNSFLEKNIKIHDIFIDQLFCPQGTGGLSLSIIQLDEELKKYYDKPAYSPLYKKLKIGDLLCE